LRSSSQAIAWLADLSRPFVFGAGRGKVVGTGGPARRDRLSPWWALPAFGWAPLLGIWFLVPHRGRRGAGSSERGVDVR
ncbi:hypothetical protein, partial [Brachybacterium phenoliresistens]|uniref:hypothetical protein n=1 Tax=Brachybacterium phenoliresistens TaxID=396014 RepID=UPI0031E1E4EB